MLHFPPHSSFLFNGSDLTTQIVRFRGLFYPGNKKMFYPTAPFILTFYLKGCAWLHLGFF